MTIYNVSEINNYIYNLISADNILQKIMVRGEISNFKLHTSGHCYLTLKDDKSAIKTVVFRRAAQKIKFRPENGMKVIACGNIGVYERDGAYQLYVSQLIPDGVGELNLYYEQLKKKLANEGLFEEIYKKPLPLYPKCIGIITSKTGAVLHDIFHVASLRNPTVKLLLYPVKVQGQGSAEEITAALKFFNKHKLCDVIIMGRGGGSIEDLWSFNDEDVVRTVFKSKIPIVSAVGHETDYTLTDFVSDMRAATPSQAAEFCVPAREEQLQKIELYRTKIYNLVCQQLQYYRERLNNCQQSHVFKQPYKLLDTKYQCIDTLQLKINDICDKYITEKKHSLDILAEKLLLLDPHAALQRGYSMIYKDKQLVNSIKKIKKTEQIQINVSDGFFSATVDEIMEGK
ncbi:exodeoxyribonuclease VII large subunit [Pectinatus brassicae]|uniref:Exodeoxyribonuclease 7 large subunit n=1 Tax=Pectinatus brassicae TaxID=862415 RepID=A0A840UGY7_9FIRM|nr:exodeoxyribonuclease VII large subunit [Pectinatus brassicae]MBB5336386.1 exodeoxyribonuclease VII large subunit [Pectinatus brassicae]